MCLQSTPKTVALRLVVETVEKQKNDITEWHILKKEPANFLVLGHSRSDDFSFSTVSFAEKMKHTIHILVVAAIMLTAIVFLIGFGFSDWAGTSPQSYEIIQAKPWRPFARLAFAFTLISMICFLGGAYIRVSYRNR